MGDEVNKEEVGCVPIFWFEVLPLVELFLGGQVFWRRIVGFGVSREFGFGRGNGWRREFAAVAGRLAILGPHEVDGRGLVLLLLLLVVQTNPTVANGIH